MAIRGKVARVLNPKEVVINVGLIDGVKTGMRFNILDARGQDIRDPDTGRLLGSIDRVKASIRVIEVKENMSIARADRSLLGSAAAQTASSLESYFSLGASIRGQGHDEGAEIVEGDIVVPAGLVRRTAGD